MPLAPHTTLGIGGEAEWLCTPVDHGDLALALRLCHRHGVPWRVLGGGSNLVVADEGVRGMVLMPRGVCFGYLTVSGVRVVAGAAVKLARLLRRATDWGLAGLEGLAGIPGRLGGAVVGNAGGRWGDIGPLVAGVAGFTGEGERVKLPRAALSFGYRGSNLSELVVTAVELELRPGVKDKISGQMADIISERRAGQPLKERSAGCIFRNPTGASAGELIDRAGLKGRRLGGAEVSSLHANFIVNRGGATAGDVLELARVARRAVQEQFDVALELEVQLWPEREL